MGQDAGVAVWLGAHWGRICWGPASPMLLPANQEDDEARTEPHTNGREANRQHDRRRTLPFFFLMRMGMLRSTTCPKADCTSCALARAVCLRTRQPPPCSARGRHGEGCQSSTTLTSNRWTRPWPSPGYELLTLLGSSCNVRAKRYKPVVRPLVTADAESCAK